jgi:tetratricopeptide (TPR) repeat protein
MAIDLQLREPFPLEEYRYQRALYSFLTGDYLSSSEIASGLLDTKEKNRAILLLRLSDANMLYKRDYPGFTSLPLTGETPLLVGLMDTAYRMREYEGVLSLSRIMDGGTSGYFEGMALLQLNDLDGSRLALERVPSNDPFYPYAMVALAQIEVMKQDLKGSERRLRELLPHPYAKRYGLADRIHILLGEILFERGFFLEAMKEFSQVPMESPIYREAMAGKAWCLVRLGEYRKAIDALKGVRLDPPYDEIDKEALIILGHSYIESGMTAAAREHYRGLLEAVTAAEVRLEEIAWDKSTGQRYLSLLLKGEPVAGEEGDYLSMLQGDPTASTLLKEYEALGIMKSGFMRKEKEITGKEAYLENRIDALEEELAGIKEGIDRIREIHLSIKGRVNRREKEPFEYMGYEKSDIAYFSTTAYKYWEQVLGREVSEEAKRLVRLIMTEWIEDGMPRCRTPRVVCHVLRFLDPRAKITEGPEEIGETVKELETLGSDINVRKGEGGRFEEMLSDAREKVSKRIEKDRDTLNTLKELKEEVTRNIREIESGSEETLAGLERYIRERFIKARYEIADFKTRIIAGLEAPKREYIIEEKKQ